MAKRTRASNGATPSQAPNPVTTQRAYTLRLRRAPGSCPKCSKDDCTCWRDALWATHEAVNRGAKAFGDWLLTLRGGLSHELAEPPAPAAGESRSLEETAALRKNRRILLALSWLSVEDEHGAPTGDVRVATGREARLAREQKVLAALTGILKARGVKPAEIGDPAKKPEDQPGTWIGDCAPSLTAAIREDAVWIKRGTLFDAASSRIQGGMKRADVWELLDWVHKPADAYFDLVGPVDEDESESPAEGKPPRAAKRRAGKTDRAKDLAHDAGNWLVLRFPKAAGADFASVSNQYKRLQRFLKSRASPGKSGASLLAELAQELGVRPPSADAVTKAFTYSGAKKTSPFFGTLPAVLGATSVSESQLNSLSSAVEDAIRVFDKKIEGRTRRPKGHRAWTDAVLADVARASGIDYSPENGKKHHFEYCVMLDHAARRVSIVHSWIKRAEAERQRFTEDAKRIDRVPREARAWLDAFCAARSEASGAVTEYRIRRRAIEGWDEVVRRWSSAACKTAADRIAAAREVQSDPEIEKFGDIQLFEALAADDAECVWRPNGAPTPDPLKDYVAATDAWAKQRRFKVPAYRHPDPLAHPVFCDFGNSRWNIRFAVHEAAKAARGGKRVAKGEKEWIQDRHGLRMGLWDGRGVRPVDLRWSSKRLVEDLALREPPDDQKSTEVPRADRLGRATAGLDTDKAARVAGLFDEEHWNGRLQAPRAELDALWNRVVRQKKGWDETALAMRDRIGWLVSFSPRLQCSGPFVVYAAQHGIRPNRKGEYYPHGELNQREKREGHAKLVLSRLPGLRVVSVDLGHRFAAACAVWEALSSETFKTEIEGREIVAGSKDADSLYCHARHKDCDGKARTTIYRRIGPDKLADGSDHPAPWARLDRQFLIKLQGEDRPARAASPAEIAAVRQFETVLGRVRGEHDRLPRRVDALMGEAVRTARLAIRRHGDAARIAYAFKPDAARLTPGGGAELHTPQTRAAAILDALLRWHELATGTRWRDAWAAEQWTAKVQPQVGAALPALADDADRWQRKGHRAEVKEALKPVADSLSQAGTDELYALWSARWADEDRKWPRRLRWLRDWLLPRRLRARPNETLEQAAARKACRGAARHVGGLSLTRIATLRELYQLQKAYAMRPGPDDPRKRIAARGDDRYDEFGRSVLQVVERLREQRVKQLASRIVEAALGVGRAKPSRGRDRQRPQSRVDAPCHAVVIESLRNYRPDELQTRRENRALMNWSAGKVRKYLEEACQLHGLHLREVMPNYTSRQCSRTGLPGLRCDDVSVADFLNSPWWSKLVNAAKKRLQENGSDSLDRLLVALREKWSAASDQEKRRQRTLRLPRAGGDLFVAAPPKSCQVRGHHPCPLCNGRHALQADLNAAANIGLRAMLDPDFPGRWWYIPCIEDRAVGTAVPRADKVKGSMCFGPDPLKPEQFGSLLKPSAGNSSDRQSRLAHQQRTRRSNADGKETTNFWSDPHAAALRNTENGGFWLATPAYWRGVRKRVVATLWQVNGLADGPPET